MKLLCSGQGGDDDLCIGILRWLASFHLSLASLQFSEGALVLSGEDKVLCLASVGSADGWPKTLGPGGCTHGTELDVVVPSK